jgi:hypothetical protein
MLTVGEIEHMVVNLREGFQIVLVPNHRNNPRDAAGRVDWGKVGRIKIMRIGHDTCGK